MLLSTHRTPLISDIRCTCTRRACRTRLLVVTPYQTVQFFIWSETGISNVDRLINIYFDLVW